jgi:adenine-specific DNA glycosylase
MLWLRRRLLLWFAQNGRSFRWRELGTTPYQVIVAEILLQRTAAAAVARAYSGFVERFPSWAALAQATLDDLENALRPLGRWRFSGLRRQSRPTGMSFPARARSWSACGGSARTQRERCWTSCTGGPSRSSM